MSIVNLKYLSVKIKILSLLSLVLGVIFFILPYYTIRIFEKELVSELLNEVDKKISNISKLHVNFLSDNDTSNSLMKLVQLENYPYVLSCSIYDENSNLFSEFKKNTQLKSLSTLPLKDKIVRNEKSIEISRIIKDSDNKTVGLLNILLTTNEITNRTSELSERFLFLRIIVFIILSFIIYFFINMFLNPLTNFKTKVTNIIRQNDTSLDIDGKYVGEIEELRTSFNFLSDKLSDKISKNTKMKLKHNFILNSIPYGISEYDKDGNFLFGNEAFYNILRSPNKNNLVGSKFFSRIDNKIEREKLLNLFLNPLDTESKSTKINQFITEINRYDNSKISVQVDWNKKINSKREIIGFVFVTTDVSKEIEMKKELEIITNEMDNIAKTRTASLERELDSIKNKQKKIIQNEKLTALGSLVAGVAHEINTPLGIGISLTSNIHERTEEIITDIKNKKTINTEDFTNLIQESTNLILKNLNKIDLQIKQFKTLAIEKRKDDTKKIFNVSETLKEIISKYEKEIKKKSLKVFITCAKDFEINSFCAIFIQIISNLVSNSLVHGFDMISNGMIKINVKNESGKIIIDYSDNGIGIPIELHEKIFEPFYTSTRGSGNSGLGLYIIYSLITSQLKGSINIENPMNIKGIEYKIEFPE